MIKLKKKIILMFQIYKYNLKKKLLINKKSLIKYWIVKNNSKDLKFRSKN